MRRLYTYILNYSIHAGRNKKILLILFLLAGPALAAPVHAQDNYEIRKIKFSGNKTFGKSDLLDNMVFRQSNIINRWIQRKDPSLYSDELMDSDIERLTRFYQSQGFLDVYVELDSLALNNDKRTLNIHIGVQEGSPVLVDSISLHVTDSLETVPNRTRFERRMSRRLELKEGRRFVDQSLYSDINRMNSIFSNFGYVYSKTNFELNLRPEQKLTDIYYNVQPGRICHFGETTIEGNEYVKEKYIRRQLNYEQEEVYDQEELDKTRRQLYNLQLFRVVSITPQTDAATERNPIPISIRIEEKPRWMSKFGLGWGTEDRFRAFADVTYHGLFGGTSRVNLYLKHSYLTPYHASLSWIEPQFFLKKLSLTVNPYIIRENEPNYNVQRLGVNIPFSYVFTDNLTASLGYYLERVKNFDVPNISTQPEIPEGGNDTGVFDPESQNYLYNKSGLSASVSYSNARPVVSPRRGGMVTLGAKLNGYIFGGDFSYTRLWLEGRKYQRLGRFTLAGRAMIGGIHSSDDSGFIPVEDRFYSGGSNSNRGWARSMLAPVAVNESTGIESKGGQSIIEMNLEVRHPLFWEIELAAFVDAGNVWKQSYHYRFNEFAAAAGGGIRVNTPIGPVRLDVGVPLTRQYVPEGQRKVQFFLSIGQAF